MNTVITSPVQHSESWPMALTDEQRIVFMEVIEESLRLSNRTHLFNWLQRGFQFLLAHEVIIIAVRGADRATYDYEYLTSSRYFADKQFDSVLNEGDGLVNEAFNKWAKLGVPLFYHTDIPAQQHHHFAVEQVSKERMLAAELKSFVVHGIGGEHNRVATMVMFGRLNAAVSPQTAHLLELLMPHLHCAIVKVTASRQHALLANSSRNHRVKPLSKREIEVIEWLQAGKTNWEIGNIMQVSPLTIKNHVQNILRKLDVENRSQAASKAMKLGLITRKP